MEAAVRGLVRTAFDSVDRLRAAAEQLRTDDPEATEALDLLDAAIEWPDVGHLGRG